MRHATSAEGRIPPLALLALLGALVAACAEEPAEAPAQAPVWDDLVFLRASGAGASDIWLARISSGATAPLIETPDVVESAPRWVPAMLRIVYRAIPLGESDHPRLQLIDPRNGQTVGAAEQRAEQEGPAVVSRDGTRLAFAYVALPGQIPPRGVRVLDPMTGKTDDLTPVGPSSYPSLEISAAKDSVVVQAHREGRGDDIWLLLAEGRRPVAVAPSWNDLGPRFGHPGDAVFFTRAPFAPGGKLPPGGGPTGGGDVCRVVLASRELKCPVQSADAREFDVAPSPVAAEMVYVRARGDEVDLYLSDLDGQNERRLTRTPESERDPVWSPDGERIAFEVGQAGSRRVRVVDRQGALLFETPGTSPAWTPPLL